VKENRSSITAEGIAIMRGIKSLKPPGERICYDPYARQFANPLLWYLAKFFVDTGYTEMTGPGVGAFIVARERYYVPIDFTTETLKNGYTNAVMTSG
jgi:O-methyltransferase involved in polyketide biosynthesis